MNSRTRFRKAINHEPPDRPPIDLGATWVTGISASAYARLRQALGLPQKPPHIHEPYQFLGDVEEDVRKKIGVDVIGLWAPSTIFGFRNDVGWKPWTMPDGTGVMVSNDFQTTLNEKGEFTDDLISCRTQGSERPTLRLPAHSRFVFRRDRPPGTYR